MSDFAASAREMIQMADRFSANGELSVTEMQTFLTGTKHEPFMRWLCDSKNFGTFDTDKSSTLGLDEVERAMMEHSKQKMRDRSCLSQSQLEGGLETFFVEQTLSSLESPDIRLETNLTEHLCRLLHKEPSELRTLPADRIELLAAIKHEPALQPFSEWLGRNAGSLRSKVFVNSALKMSMQQTAKLRASEDPQQAAEKIMLIADRFEQNGELTLAEMQTFLAQSEYAGFVEWLTRDVHSKVPPAPVSIAELSLSEQMLHKFDKDGSSSLDLMELMHAIAAWSIDEKSLGESLEQYNDYHLRNSGSRSAEMNPDAGSRTHRAMNAVTEQLGLRQSAEEEENWSALDNWRKEPPSIPISLSKRASTLTHDRKGKRKKGFLVSQFPLTHADKEIVPCPDKCKVKNLRRYQIVKHRKVCPRRRIPCSAEGCTLEVPREEMQAHVRLHCPHVLVSCPNLPCCFTGERRLLEEHLAKDCISLPAPCPNKCGALVLRRDINNHVTNDCPKRASLRRESILARVLPPTPPPTPVTPPRTPKPKTPPPCERCGLVISPRAAADHNNHRAPPEFVCAKLPIKCARSCGATINFCDKQHHSENECVLRPVACARCGVKVKEQYMDLHQNADEGMLPKGVESCVKRTVNCHLDCGIKGLFATKLHEHTESFCPRRLQGCETCGQMIEARFLAAHMARHRRDERMGFSGAPARLKPVKRKTERRSRSTVPALQHRQHRRSSMNMSMNPMPVLKSRKSFRHPCTGGSRLGCSVVKRSHRELNELTPFRYGFQQTSCEENALLPVQAHHKSRDHRSISKFLQDTRLELECTGVINMHSELFGQTL